MIYINYHTTPLGKMVMASDGESLTHLVFEDKPAAHKLIISCKPQYKDLHVFDKTKMWLDEYFGNSVPNWRPDMSLTVTRLQREVLSIVLGIKYGDTMTYGDISKIIFERYNMKVLSARAIGGAVGKNPVLLIIPCHRVVGSNETKMGYSGGIDRKIELLRMEKDHEDI